MFGLLFYQLLIFLRFLEIIDFPDLIAGLLASILLAILVFETFEKWYLRLSSISIGILSVILFLISVIALNTDIWTNRADFPGLEAIRDNMTIGVLPLSSNLINHSIHQYFSRRS